MIEFLRFVVTAVMIDSHICQGSLKKHHLENFFAAKSYEVSNLDCLKSPDNAQLLINIHSEGYSWFLY